MNSNKSLRQGGLYEHRTCEETRQRHALLLPYDFDSAKTRARYFGDCPHFVAKIALTKRIVWFERNDGIREAPKENSAWFLWQRSPLRLRHPPVILYAPANAARELPYDATDDFSRSIDEAYTDMAVSTAEMVLNERGRYAGNAGPAVLSQCKQA